MTTSREAGRILVLASAAFGVGLAAATPAAAGGIIVVASPSHDNACTNLGTTAQSGGETRNGSGTVGGLLAAVPVGMPLNNCGGADLPMQKVVSGPYGTVQHISETSVGVAEV
ncbi:hypothetical protein GCM10010326_70530 [Streptomyces xanthochromogenes]|uniref:Chaplin domain-containing protein n=1 Tax=Streptomyces xanthochromogenes TaxID=67384 RepID=A0ABQ3AUI9_9ACTN|nr:hypothetical protein GCM10010326_70530 [Streptomyces xanthochromogenes]